MKLSSSILGHVMKIVYLVVSKTLIKPCVIDSSISYYPGILSQFIKYLFLTFYIRFTCIFNFCKLNSHGNLPTLKISSSQVRNCASGGKALRSGPAFIKNLSLAILKSQSSNHDITSGQVRKCALGDKPDDNQVVQIR